MTDENETIDKAKIDKKVWDDISERYREKRLVVDLKPGDRLPGGMVVPMDADSINRGMHVLFNEGRRLGLSEQDAITLTGVLGDTINAMLDAAEGE